MASPPIERRASSERRSSNGGSCDFACSGWRPTSGSRVASSTLRCALPTDPITPTLPPSRLRAALRPPAAESTRSTLPDVEYTVVIPAFNDRAVVTTAVEVALADPLTAQVVVVDDGSADDTAAVVDALGDPRIDVIRQTNNGPGAARNAGAARATSSHLIFLDADDLLLPGALGLFADEHDRSGSPMVRSGTILVEADSESTWLADPCLHAYPRGSPLPGAFSVERATFLAVGGYDPAFRFGENSELLYRLAFEVGPDRVAYLAAPTARKIERVGRHDDHYRASQVAAAQRMLEQHRRTLRSDPDTLASHHAIVAHRTHHNGGYPRSLGHALAAARVRPRNARNWARVLQMLTPPRR